MNEVNPIAEAISGAYAADERRAPFIATVTAVGTTTVTVDAGTRGLIDCQAAAPVIAAPAIVGDRVVVLPVGGVFVALVIMA